jgi:hypothetical protein
MSNLKIGVLDADDTFSGKDEKIQLDAQYRF